LRKWGLVLGGAVASVTALSACSSLLGDFTVGDDASSPEAGADVTVEVGQDSTPDVAPDIVVKDSPAEAETGPTCGTIGLQCCGTSCTTGACCAGTCVDTTNDAKNCGACGHDCLVTTCGQSQCAPQQLCKTADTRPGRVRLDSANAYFITVNSLNNGSLYSCSQQNFATPTTLFGGIQYGYDLVLDGNAHALVADGNAQKLYSCAVGGCSGTPSTVPLTASGNLSGLATHNGKLIASIGVQPYSLGFDGSSEVDLGNGNEGTNWVAAPPGSQYVYWQNAANHTVRVGTDGTANGGSDFWGMNNEAPTLIEAGSSYVAWVTSTNTGYNVWSCQVGSTCTSSNELGQNESVGSQAGALAVDDMTKNVYWIGPDSNASHILIRVCSGAGCSSKPATLASVPTTQGKAVPGALTTNAGFVYFTMEDSGAVYLYRVAK
jgi:hypothetical protein